MAGPGVLRPVLAPARALRSTARIVFPRRDGARSAGGGWGRGRTGARGLQRQGLAAQAGCGRGPCDCIFFGFLARSLLFISFPSVLFLFSSCRQDWMPSIHPAALERGAQTAGAGSGSAPPPAQPGRRRLPGRAQPGAGQGRGGSRGAGPGVARVGRGGGAGGGPEQGSPGDSAGWRRCQPAPLPGWGHRSSAPRGVPPKRRVQETWRL